ncbi:unnamed protein product [Cuscuta epithymum]|uniref:Uncharacterized protein n=1 Tax=Cuscuta epithymum TaxID=186058 RepID=A0AAV0FY94_9ASTE|nr:unnamed protein product [Cuscuta epithymum]
MRSRIFFWCGAKKCKSQKKAGCTVRTVQPAVRCILPYQTPPNKILAQQRCHATWVNLIGLEWIRGVHLISFLCGYSVLLALSNKQPLNLQIPSILKINQTENRVK